MKTVVNISRVLVGALFIFSGLVKAIDPRGLSYKMQEFFEAWSHSGFMPSLMAKLGHYALSFSIIMITLEVAVGVALLMGWQRKLTTWILSLLIIFFTFLTAYVLFSGKIRACGCFGDCIPITPIQTFTKDIILLILSLILLAKWKLIVPVGRPAVGATVTLLATLATLFLQWYVLSHLPLKDCLPFKKGNNILELRKMPPDAVPDKFDMLFVYEKAGVKKEFKVENLPDSSWTFVDRKQTLVEKGKNNIPAINDFSLSTAGGTDTTEAVYSQPGIHYILFVKDINDIPANFKEDTRIISEAGNKKIPILVVTAQRASAASRYTGTPVTILGSDATAIKTAARAGMVLYKMQGAVVLIKWGWADFDEVSL
jgi:uncharacterized membrane protein YphA (DoxX/SURF4 family)